MSRFTGDRPQPPGAPEPRAKRKAVVQMPYTGSRLLDLRRAEAAVRELFEDPAWQRPRGWTWHHVGDGRTLQLVPTHLHGELPHTGLADSLPPTPPPRRNGRPARPLPLLETGRSLPPKAIERLEQALEVRLPASYARFLAKGNGGAPRVAAFRTSDDHDEAVDRFLSLGSGDADDLISWLEHYAERLPEGFLPIAYDPFGNLLGLDLLAESGPPVLLWDHELEPEGDEDERANLRPVAPTFAAFLESFFADE